LTRIIAVSSGKGGVGKTTFTANMALALNYYNQKVVIVDCNVTTPHLANYLGVTDHQFTLNDVLKGKVSITDAIQNYNGIVYIPASEELKDLEKINILNLKHHVRKLFFPGLIDFVFLDSAPGLGREALAVLEAANEVIFITTPSLQNLVDVRRVMTVAGNLKHKKFSVVLNMVNMGSKEYEIEEAQKFLGIPLTGVIPWDVSVADSFSLGKPVLNYKPKSLASQYFLKIAELMTAEHQKEEGILSRLRNRFFGKNS